MAKVWVVVADSARGRVFEAENRVGKELVEIESRVRPEARAHGRDLEADRPGRTHDIAGQGRHAYDPPYDVKEHEAASFAHELGGAINKGFHEGRFKHLCVVAAPHFLGLLREELDTPVRRAVSHELAKDVSHLERPAEIRRHLPDFLY